VCLCVCLCVHVCLWYVWNYHSDWMWFRSV